MQGSLGAIPFQDLTQVTYWVDPATLCFSMLVLMGLAETRRMQDFKNPGSMGEQDFLGLETALGGSGVCVRVFVCTSPSDPAGCGRPLRGERGR